MKHPNIAVIIPSKDARNLTACSEAVKHHDPCVYVIAVWDRQGSAFTPPPDYFKYVDEFIQVTDPFVFSRNVNRGIIAAGERDGYIVMNDDALLQSPGGLSLLHWTAGDHNLGLVAATTNVVGNQNQEWKGRGFRHEPRMACFICVYIPTYTIQAVRRYEDGLPWEKRAKGIGGARGLLDERFEDYGCEDDDYCLRIRLAGLNLGVHDGCYVDHGTLKSSYAESPEHRRDFRPNLKRFIEKWGHDNRGLGKRLSPWRELFA